MADLSAGCRGVIGPVPRPLWMNAISLNGGLEGLHIAVQMLSRASAH